MAGSARPDYPGGGSPAVLLDMLPAIGPASLGNVRRLRRRLWTAARQCPERRFHALYDRVRRSDVLWEAWEQKRIVRYYLHRWPSARPVKRLREKVRARTGRNRVGVKDIREVIADLNPLLRGWGNYFRTGNAAAKFGQAGDCVVWRLRRLMINKRGRNLRAGQVQAWTKDWFGGHGLYRLRGTIRYPKAA